MYRNVGIFVEDEEKRFNAIIAIFREWVQSKENAHLDVARCNRTYIRFTTNGMTTILPDIPDAPSEWNTDNHYFYEIINRNGKTTYIQFSISSKNITDEFRNICENINKYYPAKMGKDDWQWRTPFKTATIELGDELEKDAIVAKLDACMKEILDFEADLSKKLNQ